MMYLHGTLHQASESLNVVGMRLYLCSVGGTVLRVDSERFPAPKKIS